MTWTVHDEEFEAVTSLAPEARYEYFVKRAADQGEVWALTREDPEARSGTAFHFVDGPAGRLYLPVWPNPRYAAAWAEGEIFQARPHAVDIDHWVTYWTRRAVEDDVKPLVFPTSDDPGHLVGARELQRDLLDELAKFEAE
jgi:Protein of unknown function (DUF2750)